MDLSFSPDVDARVCYLLILLCALIAAYRQVDRRLATFPGSWTETPTWLLYVIYVLAPLCLFWLLDRTGAINDTSVVAALLVGVGYERILSGQGEVGVPAAFAGFWKPFADFADSISARVSKRIADRIFRFDRRLIDEVAADPKRFEALKVLARSLSRDVQALDRKLEEIRASNATLGERLTLEKQILALYAEVTQAPRWLELLREGQVTGDATFKSYPTDSGVGSRAAEIALPLACVLVFLALSGKLTDSLDREYHLWRLDKVNATATDQWRTREALTAYVADPRTTAPLAVRITELARGPAMQPGRMDLVLQVLIAGAKQARQVPLVAAEIVGSLRAPVVENRTRMHAALLHLAQIQLRAAPCPDEGTAPLPKELCSWKPTDGDSTVDIEVQVDRWTTFWSPYIPKPAAAELRPDTKP
jgi:hypothetical protein